MELMDVSFSLDSQSRFDQILQWRLGNALYPLSLHFFRRSIPYLSVVGDQVLLRQPFAKCVVNPVSKIILRTRLVIYEVIQALEDVFFVQDGQPVLEWIFDEPIFEPDGVFSIKAPGFVTQHR